MYKETRLQQQQLHQYNSADAEASYASALRVAHLLLLAGYTSQSQLF